MHSRLFLSLLCYASCTASLFGQTVRFQTDLGNIDVVLLPEVAPNTVANFLNYVNRSDYNNSFFHRSVSNFVIQGGGFKFINNQTQTIPTDPPVVNEFHVSNTRGTLAMAKLGGDPNSATSQWFFNESDANAGPPSNLDSQNGGFTVFGRITNTAGLGVMDAIAAVPTTNAGSPFDQLPVRNFSPGTTIQDANLVHVISISIIAPANTRGDFNGDGFTDYLLLNSGTRSTAIWHLHGSSLFSSVYGPTLPAGWTVVNVADFNNDQHPDYLLYNASTRQSSIWYLNGGTRLSSAFGPTLPSGWTLLTAVDFNADSKPDYLLFNPSTRKTAIWYLNGTTLASSAYGPTLPAGWTLADVIDFNANGKPDFLLFNSGSRQTVIWYLNGAALASSAYGPTLPSGWILQGAADFNGNGKPDYVLYHPSTRKTALWFLNGTTLASSAFGPTLPSGFNLVFP